MYHGRTRRLVPMQTFALSASRFRALCDLPAQEAANTIKQTVPAPFQANVAAAVGAWRRVRRDTQQAASYMISQLAEPHLPDQITFCS